VQDPLLWLLGLLALVAAALWWALRRERMRGSRASAARMRRAQQGEAEAEELLERAGYRVLERQASRSWTVEVDGEARQAHVRADLLARRDGLLYVVEIKTGERAPNPMLPATRRQLLEYRCAFMPDGLLLADMEAERLVEVAFPELDES